KERLPLAAAAAEINKTVFQCLFSPFYIFKKNIKFISNKSPFYCLSKLQNCNNFLKEPDTLFKAQAALKEILVSRLLYFDSHFSFTVLHSHGPIDGSLYAKVRKKSSSDASIPSRIKGATNNNSDHSDHTLSVSSDSGHSTASVRTEKTEEHPPGIKRILSPQEKEELDQLLSGFGLENSIIPLMEMTDAQSKYSGTCHIVPAQVHVNGDVKHKGRETDILDDEMPTYDLHSVDSFGTLSSSEGQQSNHLGNLSCHKSYQNSLLSDGFGSNIGEEHHNILAADLGVSVDSMYERSFGRIDTKSCQQLLKNPPVSTHPSYSASSYSTQTWVRQQQMVIANQYINTPENEVGFGIHNIVANVGSLENQARVPNTLLQSSSSRSEVQRRLGSISSSSNVVKTSEPEVSKLRFFSENGGNNNELKQNTRSSAGVLPSSPTLDIDQSIEQLNRLILDLDPTFEPIPTRIDAANRDSDQLNDFVSHQRNEERLGRGSRFHVKTEVSNINSSQQGFQDDGRLNGKSKKLNPESYDNDISTQSICRKYRWTKSDVPDHSLGQDFLASTVKTKEMGIVSYLENLNEEDGSIFSPRKNTTVPLTPALPVSSKATYVKTPLQYQQLNPTDHDTYVPSENCRSDF
ncbi:hypothetical protein E2320_002372, partial [Naja naja]